MSPRPLLVREWADRDVENAVDYYRREASARVALHFIDAVQDSYQRIVDDPLIGSARYAHEMEMPELRFSMVRRFPYLVFYHPVSEGIEVWRILHGHRNIPGRMREPPE